MWNALNGEFIICSVEIGFSIFVRRQTITQMLHYNKSTWDVPVDEGIQEKWAKWKFNLNILKDIRLSRCYKPERFGQVVSSSLHHFLDASENGYGQVVYERLVNAIGKIHCSLVIAK